VNINTYTRTGEFSANDV